MHKTYIESFPEESAEELYENAPCGYVSSLPDGTIIKINQTLLHWLGYQREDVLYLKKIQDLLTVGGKIFYETHHAPLLQMQGFVRELNYDILRKNLSKFAALINAVEVKDKSGRVILIRTTITDITERKIYELELIAAKKRAEQATKIKAEFLSTISHEIRTPMNAVIGIAHLLQTSTLTTEQKEWVGMLKSSSEHLLNLINNVLDFSKIESGKITLEEKSFNLRELLSSTIFGLQVKANEKNLSLDLQLDEALPAELTGDPVKISQILTNLVGNAIKFTDKGSVKIVVQLKERSNNTVHIDFSVIDTGIGIPLDKQAYIFEEFAQASASITQTYGGTGLGLSISRKLLELYGSTLGVKSEPGKGSVFYFSLKLCFSDAAVQKRVDLTAFSKKSLKGASLLIAEDNEVNVLILSHFLRQWEIDFDVVPNGILAVEQVKEKKYDLLLMDLQMPVMNGYEATRTIRLLPGKQYQDIPIIALSASSKSQVPETLQAAGITDFIGKPFEPNELFQKIAFYTSIQPESILEDELSLKPIMPVAGVKVHQDTTINIGQFISITGNNIQELQKLITLTADAFATYKVEFVDALMIRDIDQLRKIAHKSRMAMTLLEANKLIALIQESETIIENQLSDAELSHLTLKVETELDTLIKELQAFKT